MPSRCSSKGLTVNGATHNVVYIATMNNSGYAIDGDNGKILWRVQHGTPIITTHVQDPTYPNINAAFPTGILSTPVNDLATNTLYYVHGSEVTPKLCRD